jgi:tetraacyldisaccharide 4'-kinase
MAGSNGLAQRISRQIEAGWRRPGPAPLGLRLLAGVFGALVQVRHTVYGLGLKHAERLDVPVIVVGNRIVGGAGKTPTTLALVAALKAAGWRPGIVSRGHGRKGSAPQAVSVDAQAREVGDEPLLMARRTQVPVWVGRDRVAAARALRAAQPQVNVLVCDDGLQHLRLARDLEVLVFDERGAGNGLLLPAGPLREPIDTPSSAPQLLIYNAERPSTALPGHLARRSLAGAVALSDWWRGVAATPQALAALAGRPLLACAGTGQPERFFEALRARGLTIKPLPLPDHHDFADLPWQDGTIRQPMDLVLTEKDAIKLTAARVALQRPHSRIWVVPLTFEPPTAFFAEVLAVLDHLPKPTASAR